MTDNKDGGSKRPHATLDLKATEVKPTEASTVETKRPDIKGSEAKAETKPADLGETAAKAANATSPTEKAPAQPAASSASGKPGEKASAPGTSSAASKPAAAPRSRLLGHLLAGCAGGFLALAGASRFEPELAQLLGSSRALTAAELQKRVAALEQAAKEQPQAFAAQLKETDQRLVSLDETRTALNALSEAHTRLEGETKALADKVQAAGASPEAARVAKLEERFQTLAAAAGTDADKGRIQGLAALTGKVTDLSDSIDGRLAAERKVVSDYVEQRFNVTAEAGSAARAAAERLEKELMVTRTETAQLAQRSEALRMELGRLAVTIEAMKNEGAATTSALSALDAALKAQLDAVARPADVASAIDPLSGKLTNLEQRLEGVMKSENERKSNASRIVLALELANLKRAIERGDSYERELSEVRKAAPAGFDFKVLEARQDSGVASLAALERDFKPVIRAAIDAAAMPSDGSLLDRLSASARSMVRVRRTSHDDNDKSAEAVLGRMERALQENRLGDVMALANDLPASAAPAAAGFLAKVVGRHAVDEAITAIEAALKTSLSGNATAAPATLQN